MTPLRDTVDALCAFAPRSACHDPERRAALWLHDDLRARGHDAWLETVWVRPQWPASLALHAVLGVAASLASTAEAAVVPALAVAAVALVSYALELTGYGGLLPRLFYRRATQLVVVEPPEPDAIALVITVNVDAPRRGLALREGVRRLGGRMRPGPLVWVALALAAVAAACGARVAGAEGTVVGALQLVPTVVLLVAAAAALDVALAEVTPGASDCASGVAVALALHEELAARPPARLSPTLVLEIGPCGSGTPAWHTHHRQLAAAAASVTEPAARRRRLNRPSAAGAARGRGLPAIAVRAVDERGTVPRARTAADVPEAVEAAALEDTLDFCLAVVDALDAELGVQT
ncbi:MAG TPA: hypothetical protein VM266_00275 [Solirubrobacteraceae bacterium]|nr:hypothetical protein [Solirubrobacteraceae bacterium]